MGQKPIGYCAGKLIENCRDLQLFCKRSRRPARDLQTFLVFCQHPKRLYDYAGKPIENAVYCFINVCYTLDWRTL